MTISVSSKTIKGLTTIGTAAYSCYSTSFYSIVAVNMLQTI